jgi:hypothetical protein
LKQSAAVFWANLKEDNTITDAMRETIELKSTTQGITSEFLRVLQTRGPRAYDRFIAALRASDREFVADELEQLNNNGVAPRVPVACTDN